MTRPGLRRPTPSMLVAVTAMVVALGGTSYAVVKPSPRSVGAKELKRKAVSAAHIKANAITSRKVKDGSLKGRDIDEASLGAVPLATRATSVESSARAAMAGGIERVFYRVSTVAIPPPVVVGESTQGIGTARCDPGQLVIGGGVKLEENMSVVDGYPDGAAAWTANANNDEVGQTHNFTVYAICVPATTPG
jgi:hypothetical protein